MAPKKPSSSVESRFAQGILSRNLGVQKGDRVTIETWTHTLPWAAAMAREARRIGARPMVLYEDEGAYWDSVNAGETKLLGKPGKHEWAALAKTDAYIFFSGPADRERLSRLPRETLEELEAYNEEWYAVARKRGLRGVRLEIARPSPELSRLYGVDMDEWRREIVDASLVDPLAISKEARELSDRLRDGERLSIRHPNGTNLHLRLAGKRGQISTGRAGEKASAVGRYGIMTTVPGGVVNVALDEMKGDGNLIANRTSFFETGKATGARWRFKAGKLTSWAYDSGEALFREPYKSGGIGRDRIGGIRFGLNPKIAHAPQVEDLERGTITLTVGNNAYLGGGNAANFGSWALVGGANVDLDGEPLVRSGAFV